MINYIERKLYIQTPAIDLLMAIARSGLYANYTLYEQPHEWALALGNLASIRATADTVTLFSEEQCQRFSCPRLSDAIAEATAALPVKDWRLYGSAQFELSHIFHGVESTRIATDQPLLELFVPQCEIRIEQQHLLLRAAAQQKLEALQHLIEQIDANPPRPSVNQAILAYQNIAAYRQDQYQQAVQQAVLDIKEHRYQKVIISRQIPLNQSVDILESYQTGRRNNTPARSFIYSQDGFMAAGFSPETVVEVGADRWVSTQPLAGTRAIGTNEAEEARLKAELLADTKEIAEHAVSVKLAIEELESVCCANSLSVSEFMAIRRRGSVQHLASRVKGQLAEGKHCWDAFEALFPAVTASGIPKQPAIEAIQRLKSQNRGLYSGCVMIADSQGTMDAALVLANNSASADSTVAQARSDNELNHIIQSDLQQALPGYMIPSACKVMEAIPLTANNKVNRKALREVFASQIIDKAAFEPPKDNWIEQKLAETWCELTDIERLSRNDDFFMIGGSSLTAVSLLNRLTEERFAVNIDLIFNNPVFKDMVEALQKCEDEEERFRQSIDIDALFNQATKHRDHAAPYLPQRTDSVPTKIFMTGATGYLGIYILKSVLEQTNDTLYCLIRCRDEENGYFRLQQLADEKGLALQLDRDRIKVIPGDLTADQFGIAPDSYQWLTLNIDKVLHIAALIRLIAPLSSLYPINVKGSANVIELASTHRVKPIHYMSTIGVHYRLPYHKDEPPVPEDTNSFEPWQKPELTYEHTKYMAEQLFYMARQRQIPVNIFRSGAITWDNTQASPFINDDAFVKFFRTCLSINAYPDSQILISTTPVNVVARYIALLSKSEITSEGKNYHVVSRYSHTGDQIYQWLNSLGGQFEKLGFEQWNQKLADSFGRGFINRYFKHGMDQGGHHQYRIDNLEAALTAIGEVPFEVTPDYFTPIVDHFSKAIHQAARQSAATTETEA